jgi:hypothetical protein
MVRWRPTGPAAVAPRRPDGRGPVGPGSPDLRPTPDRPAHALRSPGGRRSEARRWPPRRGAERIIRRSRGDGWDRPRSVRGTGIAARPADGPAGMRRAFRPDEIIHSAQAAERFRNVPVGLSRRDLGMSPSGCPVPVGLSCPRRVVPTGWGLPSGGLLPLGSFLMRRTRRCRGPARTLHRRAWEFPRCLKPTCPGKEARTRGPVLIRFDRFWVSAE